MPIFCSYWKIIYTSIGTVAGGFITNGLNEFATEFVTCVKWKMLLKEIHFSLITCEECCCTVSTTSCLHNYV